MNDIVTPQRKKRIIELDAALDKVADGMTIAIGGFINSSHPMLVVRGIIKRKIRNLTVVGAASSGLEIDLLIAAGCAAKVIAPYVGGEVLAPIGPAFRTSVERGKVEVIELDEAMYYAGLRAAAQRVPFNPWRSGVGTSFPDINPAIKTFKDPINGETLLAIPAINLDIAFLHADASDAYGNVQYVGHGYGDRAIYAAADQTYVQVERVIANEDVRRDPMKTAIPGADGIIRAPFGAHPYSSPGHYIEDKDHIRQYVKAATTWAKSDDFGPLQQYLDEFITGPEDHTAYLERVGLRRLLSLNEY
jgi:glutaconate CoA-transferase subunit A